jgi:hypothetical protein
MQVNWGHRVTTGLSNRSSWGSGGEGIGGTVEGRPSRGPAGAQGEMQLNRATGGGLPWLSCCSHVQWDPLSVSPPPQPRLQSWTSLELSSLDLSLEPWSPFPSCYSTTFPFPLPGLF